MKSHLIKVSTLNAAVAATTLAISTSALAEESNWWQRPPNSDGWQCEYCLLDASYSASLGIDVGVLSEENYYFGDFRGIDGDSFAKLFAIASHRDKTGRYFDFAVSELGIESPQLDFRYGLYGTYKFDFSYQEIARRFSDQAYSPYANPGSASLNLNAGFAPIDATPLAASDISSLTQFELKRDWQDMKLSWQHSFSKWFDYQFDYRQIKKNGIREFSAAQVWNASYLPLVVDHKSDQFDASIKHSADQYWLSFGYGFSNFENATSLISFENPFTSLGGAPSVLSLASEPDNEAAYYTLNAGFVPAPATSVSVGFTRSEYKQDQVFAPYSTNSTLNSALPFASLDGKVVNTRSRIKLSYRVSAGFNINAKYDYRKQDNQSTVGLFVPVVMDTYAGEETTNRPYDYNTRKLKIAARWRFLPGQLMAFEFEDKQKERFNEIATETRSTGVASFVRLQHQSGVQFTARFARTERDAELMDVAMALSGDVDPLQQKYNQAARDEDLIRLQISAPIDDTMELAFSADYLDLEYIENEWGLQENRRVNYGLDFNWRPAEKQSLGLYVLREDSRLSQITPVTGSAMTWHADSLDEVDSFGFNYRLDGLFDDTTQLALSMYQSDGRTEVTMQDGQDSSIPAANTKLEGAKVQLTHRYDDNWRFALQYKVEKLDNEDQRIDNLSINEVPNLLTYGLTSLNYDVNYWLLSAAYDF